MSIHHDIAIEKIFLRRRAGLAARAHLAEGPAIGGVAVFPVCVALSADPDKQGRLYPLVELSHEPGSVFPEGTTRVDYRIASPTKGMKMDVAGWFYVHVHDDCSQGGCFSDEPDVASGPPPAGFEVLDGSLPAGRSEALPGNVCVPLHGSAALRSQLNRLKLDGDRAWQTDFYQTVRPMLYHIVGRLTKSSGEAIESCDEWGKALETAVKGGLVFSSPHRTPVSWTNWAHMTIRRDVIRERDKRSGRPHADQSVKRYAMAKRPHMSEAEIHDASTELYWEWCYESAYNRAVRTDPTMGLTLSEFTAEHSMESVVSKSLTAEQFKRALEPATQLVELEPLSDFLVAPASVTPATEMVEELLRCHESKANGRGRIDRSDIYLWLVRRNAIDATQVDVERAARIDLADVEGRFFGPWETEELSWRRRQDREAIRRSATVDLADVIGLYIPAAA